MKNQKALIVDDDSVLRKTMKFALNSRGVDTDTACSAREAILAVQTNPHLYPVVILDYHLPDHDGPYVTRKIREINPHLFTFIFSGDESREALRGSLKAGAVDFIEKNADIENFLDSIPLYMNKAQVQQESLKESQSYYSGEKYEKNENQISKIGLSGRSDDLKVVADKVIQHQKHRYTVFILGESGTGKECIARAIHTGTKSKFFAVNCAAYRDNAQLLESELFGYERGAFTGATNMHRGIFEQANEGTLFLDEVHELSVTAQAKLLRVLQERSVRRVGGTVEIPVKVRVIAGAKPIIEKKKESGEFLLDLYNRLYVFPIEISPLRERKADIEPLIKHFCKKYGSEIGKKVSFLPTTIAEMEKYSWPGNVRELENTVLRLVVGAKTESVTPKDFLEGQTPHVFQTEVQSLSQLKIRFEKEEKEVLLGALKESQFNLREAARRLQVSHTTLFSKLKKYELKGIQNSA